jgi:hypothetical protein
MTIVGLKPGSVNLNTQFEGCSREKEFSVKCICIIIIIIDFSFLELLNYKCVSSTTSVTSDLPSYLNA